MGVSLPDVQKKNGFSGVEINRPFALFDYTKRRGRRDEEEPPIRGVVVLPFYQIVTNRLTRLPGLF